VLPWMGRVYDTKTAGAVPAGLDVEQLRSAAAGTAEAARWMEAQAIGGPLALRVVAVLPIVLVVVFGILFIRDRAAGGYRAESIGGE